MVDSDGRRTAPSRRSSSMIREAAMATRACPLGRIHPHAPAMPTVSLDVLLTAGRTARRRLLAIVDARTARPRLGMLGVPLAMTAAFVAAQWWAPLPLAACGWWWAPRAWGWEWLVAVGRGLIAAEWACMGASALAAFPGSRPVVGAVWAGLPALLALSAALGLKNRDSG